MSNRKSARHRRQRQRFNQRMTHSPFQKDEAVQEVGEALKAEYRRGEIERVLSEMTYERRVEVRSKLGKGVQQLRKKKNALVYV